MYFFPQNILILSLSNRLTCQKKKKCLVKKFSLNQEQIVPRIADDFQMFLERTTTLIFITMSFSPLFYFQLV